MAEKKQLIVDLKTGRMRPPLLRAPVLSSASTPWQDVMLQQYAPGPVDLVNIVTPSHLIILQLNQAALREIRLGEQAAHSVRIQPGQTSFYPAMFPYSVRSQDTGGFLGLTIEPSFLFCTAHPLIDPEHFELTPKLAFEDPLLRAGVLALKAEIEAGSPGGRLYAETVAAALAVQLVRHYSTAKRAGHLNGGGLTPFQLRRAIDFMQAHLAEDISLESLAQAVEMSRFHFARLFKKSVGLAPHQYLTGCRVERAKHLLLQSKATIAEVALKVGFCDQSHLAIYFKRVYGVTPKAFAQRMAPGKNLL